MGDWDLEAITAEHQQRWFEAGLHRADRDPDRGRPTYWLHFAYPGISGYLHVGHMRGFTYSDVFTRYKRMTGHDVLFPAGFHASGIPAVAFAKEVERGGKTDYLLANGFDPDRDGPIEALADPEKVVEYFSRVYTHDYWKKFGFLMDDRRNCTTIDAGYNRFIAWQFRRLMDKGYLVEKPHYAPFCPVAGPVAVDKSETDIQQGGGAEVKEFSCLRFEIPAGDLVPAHDALETIVLPCATLRPETLFGVTNLWLNPDHDYELVRVWQDGAVGDDDASEVWLVSQQGRRKLEWQCERAEGLDVTITGSAVIGGTATAPLTGAKVPVVQATFVDPMIATGVVMSVPGHAPFDWAAYVDAGLDKTLGEPPQIVDIPGYDDLPARQACIKFGVKTQADVDALEEATDEVYADEFNKGVLNDACGAYAGERIKVAKDRIVADFADAGHARIIRQFSELVISRAGEVVDIKRIPDQVFIHYAHEAWTEQAKAHAAGMSIFPQRYEDDIKNVLDWFGDRACVRRGAWLGTEYPFKEGWIIEPIADSTFYPWYYLVAPFVQIGEGHAGADTTEPRPLPAACLTDAFFDYVFNGRGDLDAGVEAALAAAQRAGAHADERAVRQAWDDVRADVLHWGPVDVNLGGKEHQTVHFPVYIMNMVGLMDDLALWPRGIFVNWWVTQQAGAKISKSKGGAEPIPGAAAKYGVDPMRLYYCHVGSPHVDIEWDPEIVLGYRQQVLRLGRMADQALEALGSDHAADRWLHAAFASHVGKTREALEAYDLRTAAGELAYAIPETLRWYRRRGGDNAAMLADLVQDWARALSPLVPHIAEEIWRRAGGDGLCAAQPFPEAAPADEAALAAESYLRNVLDDAQTIAKLAGHEAGGALRLFASPAWKTALARRAAGLAADGKYEHGAFMHAVMADPEMRSRGKEVQKFAGGLAKQVNTWSALDRAFLAEDLDEAAVLQGAIDLLRDAIGVASVAVYPADAGDAPDDSKRNVASPLKPGISLA